MTTIKILDGRFTQRDGDIILFGVVADEDLDKLLVDNQFDGGYQREELYPNKIREIREVLRTTSVPPIVLSHRSLDYTEKDGVYYLSGDVYIVDGQQRTIGARHLLADDPTASPHLMAQIHFGKDREWERAEFGRQARQTSISPNIQLRNIAVDNKGVAAILDVSQEKNSLIRDRVQWQQSRNATHLFTAKTLVRSVGVLHSHITPGAKVNRVDDLSIAIDKIAATISPQHLKANMREYLRLIDELWGLKGVAYPRTVIHLKSSFLFGLSAFFSNHENFWNENTLKLDAATMKRLRTFPLTDPTIVNYAGLSGARAERMIEEHLINHVNYGRRTKRLVRRLSNGPELDSYSEEEDVD